MPEYLIKKLQRNELAYVGEEAGRRGGQFFFITNEMQRLLPPLLPDILNDTAILNVITHDSDVVHQAKYVWHNDSLSADGTRNETRLYLNRQINPNKELLLMDDIVILTRVAFREEDDEAERAYQITRFRADLDGEDYRLLSELIESPTLRLGRAAAAIVTDRELDRLVHYRERVLRSELEGIRSVIIDPENAADFLQLPGADAEDRDDDEAADLEKQLKRIICFSYGWKCAITAIGFRWTEPGGERFGSLDGAHVKPRAHGGSYRPDNILPMRKDIHRLFDRGLFGITEDDRIELHPATQAMAGMTDLLDLHGQEILVPDGCRISTSNKNWHRQYVFGNFRTGTQIRRL